MPRRFDRPQGFRPLRHPKSGPMTPLLPFGSLQDSIVYSCILVLPFVLGRDPLSRIGTTMASADFCFLISRPLDRNSQRQGNRSPRAMHTLFPAYARRIYVTSFRVSTGLRRSLPPCPLMPPRIQFLFVRPAFCLRLPSDSTSRQTPLSFDYHFPLPGVEETFTLKRMRPAGRTIKKGGLSRLFLFGFCQPVQNVWKL